MSVHGNKRACYNCIGPRTNRYARHSAGANIGARRPADMDTHGRHRLRATTGFALAVMLATARSLMAEAAAVFDSRNCTFPTKGTLRPLPAASVSNATLDDARAVAWEFAPILYLHQLEKYAFQVFSQHASTQCCLRRLSGNLGDQKPQPDQPRGAPRPSTGVGNPWDWLVMAHAWRPRGNVQLSSARSGCVTSITIPTVL